jgi:acyl-CoA synthetase (AMP-forming)/AMP-acid ligase II
MAGALRDSGFRHGDTALLRFEARRWLDFAVAFCAVLRAGGVAVPVSIEDTHAELEHIASTSGSRITVDSLWQSTPFTAEVRPGDAAQIIFTSGTTGRPKGVMATHANLTYGFEPYARRRQFAHSEAFLHAFPIGTNAAQMMLMNAITIHPAAVTLPVFDAGAWFRAVDEHRIGTAFLVPAMAIELVNAVDTVDATTCGSLKLVSSSGSALPPSVARSLTELFPGASVINCYTSTEAMPAQVMMMVDPAEPESAGLILGSIDIQIRDGDNVLPTGATGEVWLRCPTTARAYLGEPSGGGSPDGADGWVRMGDVGRLDDAGHLYLVDRESDVLNSGGKRLSATEIESTLDGHPAVREVAVFGLPHPVMGQLLAAALVLDKDTTVPEVRAFARERLAPHKVPVRWMTTSTLPRNRMGKVVKSELREEFSRGR